MTKDEQLKAGLIAANALGLKNAAVENGTVFYDFAHESFKKMHRNPFSLSNPSDCQAAVIHLGEKHGLFPMPELTDDGNILWTIAWAWRSQSISTEQVGIIETIREETYQEAVAAAYLALEDK